MLTIKNLNKFLLSLIDINNWERKKGFLFSLLSGTSKIKIPEIKKAVWRATPGWVTRDFNQQIPLTFHFIDKKTLGANWDSGNDNYYIE